MFCRILPDYVLSFLLFSLVSSDFALSDVHIVSFVETLTIARFHRPEYIRILQIAHGLSKSACYYLAAFKVLLRSVYFKNLNSFFSIMSRILKQVKRCLNFCSSDSQCLSVTVSANDSVF